MSSSSTSSVVILSPKSPVISRQTGRPLPPPPPPPCLFMAMKNSRRSRSRMSSSASRSRSRSKSHSRSSKGKKRSRKSRKHSRTRKSKRSSHRSSSLRKSKKSYRRSRSRSHEAGRSKSPNDSKSVSYAICYSGGTEEVIRLILDPNNVKIPRRLEEGIKPIFDREELKNRRRMEIDYEADDVAPIRPLPNQSQSVSLIPSSSKKDYKWNNDLYSPDTTRKFSRGPRSSKRSRSCSSDYTRNKGRKQRYKSRSRSRSSSVGLEKTAKELSKILSIKPGACWACQKVGHKWKDCRNRQDKGRKYYYMEMYCSYCNRQGHLTEHCGTRISNVTRSAHLVKKLLLERIKQEENENLEPGEIPSSPVSEKGKPTEVIVPGFDKIKTESLLEAEAVKMDKDCDVVTCWESEVERVDRKSNFPFPSSTSRQSKIPESGRWVHDKFEELI